MISNNLVLLRVWREADLEFLAALRNDVALQAHLLARVRGSTIEQVRDWVQERTRSPDSLFLMVADVRDDSPLGYLQFTGIDLVNRYAELGICLAVSAQGRGLGGEALRLALPFLRNTWAVRKFGLRVRADNDRAIRCYERIGFERCGLFREHAYIDGAWHDVVLMELLPRIGSLERCV